MYYFKIKKDVIYDSKVSSKINIVQISDLHYSNKVSKKLLNKLIDKIKELKPDYIVVTGDTIDSVESILTNDQINIIIDFFKELGNISKTIISLGNHDFYKFKNKKVVFNYPEEFWNQVNNVPNVYLLNNEIYNDNVVEFFGYTLPKDFYFSKTKEENNAKVIVKDLDDKKDFLNSCSVPKIGLMHSPACLTYSDIFEKLKNFDIILSGHMHNGGVFPVLDEIWKSNTGLISASKKIFNHNCRGRIIKNNNGKITNFIISGGIIMFSKCSPKFFHPFNIIYPHHVNQIIITDNKEEASNKTFYKYKR